VIVCDLEKALKETASYEPVLQGLKILRRLFRSTPTGANPKFHKFNDRILNMIFSALNSDHSKTVTEALRISGSFVHTLRDPTTGTIMEKYAYMAPTIFSAILSKLQKVDIDQDVKT